MPRLSGRRWTKVAEQEKKWEAVRKLAAEQGPRWPSRKDAWFDGFREGEQHARMTGQGIERVTLLEDLLRWAVAWIVFCGDEPDDDYPDDFASYQLVRPLLNQKEEEVV